MTQTSTKPNYGFWFLILALALGLLGQQLLGKGGWGINLSLWLSFVFAAMGAGFWAMRVRPDGQGRWLLLCAMIFALGFAWRDVFLLQFLNLVGLAAGLWLAAPYTRTGQFVLGGVAYYLTTFVNSSLTLLSGLMGLSRHVQWRELAASSNPSVFKSVGRGLLLAVPVLLVFGGLLTSADEAFARLVANLFDYKVGDLSQLFVFGFWAWLAAAFLHQTLFAKPIPEPLGDVPRVGLIEIGVVLGLLNLLFVSFVAVQFAYFFGGSAQVSSLTGLTFAEYARKGFFELITAAFLVLPLLLFSYRVLPLEPRSTLLFRGMSLLMLGLLGVMLTSAWQRMLLYIKVYGLTQDRLLTIAVMIWVALMLLWFALTVLRGQYNRFTFGAIALGMAVVLLMNVINPSRLIVLTNLGRASLSSTADILTQDNLGADAVPTLVANLGRVPGALRPGLEVQIRNLYDQNCGESRERWVNWNWACYQAGRAVKAKL